MMEILAEEAASAACYTCVYVLSRSGTLNSVTLGGCVVGLLNGVSSGAWGMPPPGSYVLPNALQRRLDFLRKLDDVFQKR